MKKLQEYNRGRTEREQIHVRAGLNFGVGLVEEKDVYGDLVNVASRVESLASADEIYVTEDLYRSVKHNDEFILRYVNAIPVKGKSQSLKVYRVVWQHEELTLGKTRSRRKSADRREGLFVIEASMRYDQLKVVAYSRAEGEDRPVKNFSEGPYLKDEVDLRVSGIVALLNKASRQGRVANNMLVELREHAETLYKMLLPEDVRKKLSSTEEKSILFSIDESLVHIPWELLYDGSSFLCQDFAIGRSVKTRQSVSSVSRSVSRPLKMLVLADPRGDLPASRREGALILEEAEKVSDWLDVTLKDSGITTDYVSAKIRTFDIVHYAGHAELDSAKGNETGWLLQNGTFTGSEISSLTNGAPMPAMVFSNACQSGGWDTTGNYEDQVFGIANNFLLAGVQHYIGTFREIPDEPGFLFACSFYAHIARGSTVGEAMRLARLALIGRYGEDTIVWGGYLLYGDPTTHYIDTAEELDEEQVAPKPEPIELHGAPQINFGLSKADDRSKIPWVLAAGILIAIALFAANMMGRGEAEKVVIQQLPAAQTAQNAGKEIDELVTSLAASYRDGKIVAQRKDDGWSTPPLTMVIMELNGDGVAKGTAEMFANQLSNNLQGQSGIPMVDRQILAKLLQELKLGTSALADQGTALKLGKVLSARIIITGNIMQVGDGQAVSLRFIDTETTAIRKVITGQLSLKDQESDTVSSISKQITDWIREDFPVRGKVLSVAGEKCRVNIGKGHGIKPGSRIELVSEAKKGSGIYDVTGELTVREVEKDAAVALIAGQLGVKEGDRVRLRL
jgi:CHAT domain-containing protein